MKTEPGESTFLRFARTMQQIAETRGSGLKTTIFADYIRSLESDSDAELAARFAGEGAFESVSGKRASVGHRTIAVCAADFCEIDYDKVFRPCRTATGSASEAIEKLMHNLPVASAKRRPAGLTMRDVDRLYQKLELARKREEKNQILEQAWSVMEPVEIKYFIRVMGQGSLRIGFESGSIVHALAKAWGFKTAEVRYAYMMTGSLGKTALLCKKDRLSDARFRMFQPISFMLASPVESRNVEDVSRYLAEEKFDGMRCQLHTSGGKIKLFSRDMNDITNSFPDVAAYFIPKKIPETVLDGELCAFKDERILPFQKLQKRMGLKKPSENILASVPVVFIAYDLLYHQSEDYFGKPLEERRQKLSQICESFGILMSRQFEISEPEDISRFFDRALERGNEGLMLKLKSSRYEYGQRKKSWLKVKKPGGSIDTVIMYAHAGSGKRGGTYSDFTLGISVKDDERYEEDFIPIGKAYGGYTDEELKKLNRAIKPLAVERFGPTLSLKPGIVVEIEFDDIQENKRTKAGLTLRLPRFRAIRWDLSPKDADTLKDVEQLYSSKINKSVRVQEKDASFVRF